MPPGATRRHLLRLCLSGTLVRNAPTAGPKSRVVIARDPLVRPSGGAVDSARLANLLDRAVQAVYGCDSPIEAWKKIARPNEVVGLKVNCLAGRGSSTNPALVDAVCEHAGPASTTASPIKTNRPNLPLLYLLLIVFLHH